MRFRTYAIVPLLAAYLVASSGCVQIKTFLHRNNSADKTADSANGMTEKEKLAGEIDLYRQEIATRKAKLQNGPQICDNFSPIEYNYSDTIRTMVNDGKNKIDPEYFNKFVSEANSLHQQAANLCAEPAMRAPLEDAISCISEKTNCILETPSEFMGDSTQFYPYSLNVCATIFNSIDNSLEVSKKWQVAPPSAQIEELMKKADKLCLNGSFSDASDFMKREFSGDMSRADFVSQTRENYKSNMDSLKADMKNLMKMQHR